MQFDVVGGDGDQASVIPVFIRTCEGADFNVCALFDQGPFTGDVDIKASIGKSLLLECSIGIGGNEVIFAVVLVGKIGNGDFIRGSADDNLIGSCGGCT